jgi:hypothetical protein
LKGYLQITARQSNSISLYFIYNSPKNWRRVVWCALRQTPRATEPNPELGVVEPETARRPGMIELGTWVKGDTVELRWEKPDERKGKEAPGTVGENTTARDCTGYARILIEVALWILGGIESASPSVLRVCHRSVGGGCWHTCAWISVHFCESVWISGLQCDATR